MPEEKNKRINTLEKSFEFTCQYAGLHAGEKLILLYLINLVIKKRRNSVRISNSKMGNVLGFDITTISTNNCRLEDYGIVKIIGHTERRRSMANEFRIKGWKEK